MSNNPKFGDVISVVLNATATMGYCGRLSGVAAYGNGNLPLAIMGTDGTTATAHNNCGIFLQDGVSGDCVELQISGTCEIAIAGAAITIGALATTGAGGKVTAAASGDRAFLRVVRATSAAGTTADTAKCTVILTGPIGLA